jgi:hypothetical protein
MCDRVQGQQLLRLTHGDPHASPPLIDREPEEWTAFALDRKRLVERLTIEARVELDYKRVGLALHARHTGGEAGVARALLANPVSFKGAGPDLAEGTIKKVGAGGLR